MLGLLIAFPMVLGWAIVETSGVLDEDAEASARDASDIETSDDHAVFEITSKIQPDCDHSGDGIETDKADESSMGAVEQENFKDVLAGTQDHDVFQLIAEDSHGVAQIMDFTKGEDQIEIHYPISEFSSEPAKELLERTNKYGTKSDLSIRLDGEEVAVVKGAFLEIDDKDIFLVAV
ncbi:MAG: hypothetical protein ACPG4F_10200 [Paracoccaceae bacterium]